MKKLTALFIAASMIASMVAFTGCSKTDSDDNNTKIENTDSNDSEENIVDNTNDKDESQETVVESATSTLELIELDGDINTTFTTDNVCYAESDRVIMIFDEGVEVNGYMLEAVEVAMTNIENTTGKDFTFKPGAENEQSFVLGLYLPAGTSYEAIEGIDSKVVVLVSDNIGIAQAYSNTLALETFNFSDLENVYVTIHHELTHVLQFMNGIELTSTMNEGLATYISNRALEEAGKPEWDKIQYFSDVTIDDANALSGEEGFVNVTEHDQGYQFGYRFIYYLFEIYGDDIFWEIGDAAKEAGFTSSFSDSDIDGSGYISEEALIRKNQEMADIIKDVCGEDVFDNFATWYGENWASIGEETFASREAAEANS